MQHAAFHDVVLPQIPEVAAQATLDRTVFAGGCNENAEASEDVLEADILKLYYDDYIAQWDGFLRDVRLTPINDLAEAQRNLKDLSSADSALKRLLDAVVAETDPQAQEDYDSAAAAHARAVRCLAEASEPDELSLVTENLEEGRWTVARLMARAAGEPLPLSVLVLWSTIRPAWLKRLRKWRTSWTS